MTLHDLGRSQKSDALGVLCAAFHDYPVTRYVIGESEADYDGKLRDLVGLFVESRLVRNVPLIGMSDGYALLGVAVFSPPEEITAPREFRDYEAEVRRRLGPQAMARFKEYDRACEATDPGHRAHYLGMIGILPGAQRQGLGRLLIDAVKDRARLHPGSEGIALNTETENNLPFYERAGFRMVSEADAGSIHTWSFFWPCD